MKKKNRVYNQGQLACYSDQTDHCVALETMRTAHGRTAHRGLEVEAEMDCALVMIAKLVRRAG
jgi:hypothetical protein